MTAKRGKMVYVPRLVFDELSEIMNEDGLNRRAEAFDKLTTYSKIGRKVQRKERLDRVMLKDIFGGKKKNRKNDSFF